MRTAICCWVVLGITIALVHGCASGGLSSARLAREEGPQFSHQAHLETGLACIDCHGEDDVGYNAMPELEFCNECHEEMDEEKPEDQRASWFFDEEGKGRWAHTLKQSDEIIFDHGAHVPDEESCQNCHAGIEKAVDIRLGQQVSMATCMACHEQQVPEKNECATCHQVLRKDVAPESHRVAWLQEHGRMARLGGLDPLPADCSICHTRSSCDECHRAVPPRNHTNLFRVHGHAAMASIDREGCLICHQNDSCVQCHEQAVPRSHRGGFGSPFNRHCLGCHLPLESGGQEGCAVCHRAAPSHALAPPRPGNAAHMTMNSNSCRECHNPMPHPDNGQSCLLCHQ